MLGFFEYLSQNLQGVILFVVVGIVYGFLVGLGESWSDKFKYVGIGVLMWGIVAGLGVSRIDYSDYKRHYATCTKYEAKQAGYIFNNHRCYKPITSKQYIVVNEHSLKTKEELR